MEGAAARRRQLNRYKIGINIAEPLIKTIQEIRPYNVLWGNLPYGPIS